MKIIYMMIGPDKNGWYYHQKCHSPHLGVSISKTDLIIQPGSKAWKMLSEEDKQGQLKRQSGYKIT
jgi:hypothetical protein